MSKLHHQFRNNETGKYTKEYNDYFQAVIDAGGMNFDCEQIAQYMIWNISPEIAAKEFNEDAETIKEDYEDMLNHDMSMNY